jgi:outer membrane protein assembly factor BamA
MAARNHSASFGWVLPLLLLVSSPVSGQSSACEALEAQPRQDVQQTRIDVVSVTFSGESPLSEEDRARFVTDIQSRSIFVEQNPAQVDAKSFQEAMQPIREALTDRGYFRAFVSPTPFLVRAAADVLEYSLRIEIESGPQYYVGSIRLTSADPDRPNLAFDSLLLRQKIPLVRGELFDMSKLRDGLHAISRLYEDSGYIDAIIEPEFDIRDAPPDTIDVLFHTDEGIPYRLETIRFIGLDPTAAQQLQSRLPQEAGEPFRRTLWEKFFEQNNPLLPPNTSAAENLQVSKNVKDETVSIALDFRRCQKGLQRTNPFDDPESQPR